MNKQRIFNISFLIFFLIDTINILVSVYLLFRGNLAYFITYWTLFVFEKLVFLILNISQNGKKTNIWYTCLDILQLNFLQSQDSQGLGVLKINLLFRLFGRVYPLLIIQSIYFFGLGLFSELSHIYISLVIYGNFFVLALYAGLLCSTISKIENLQSIKPIYQSIINHVSYYLSLSLILQSSDINGVNGGIYYTGVIIINILYNLITLERDFFYKQQNLFYLILGIFMNYQFLQDDQYYDQDMQNKAEIQNPVVLCYINQILRFTLLIWMSTIVILNQQHSSVNLIFIINLIFSIIWSFAFFISFYHNFIFVIYKSKWVIITNERELNFFIKNRDPKIKCLSIQIIKRKWFKCKNQAQNKKLNPQTSDVQCSLYFEFDRLQQNQKLNSQESFDCIYEQFYSQLSQYIKEGVKINLEDRFNSTICSCDKVMKLMIEEPYISNNIIQQNQNYFLNKVPFIINERISRGYLFTPFTNYLFQKIYTNKSKFDDQYLMFIESLTLKLIVYTKLIKDSMIVNPQLVILDLEY